MTHKMLLSKKFFHAQYGSLEPMVIQQPISMAYVASKHGNTIEIFKQHAEFKRFKQGYWQLLDQWLTLAQHYLPTTEEQIALENSIQQFKQHLFQPSYCNARPEHLWNSARGYLEALLQRVQQLTLPTEQTRALLNNLISNLIVCPDGVVTHLQTTLQQLTPSTMTIVHAKTLLVEQLILQFMQAHQLSLEAVMEIHYVNAFINALSQPFGLTPRPYEQTVTTRHPWIQAYQQPCQGYLLEQLPYALVAYLTNELLVTAEHVLQVQPATPWKAFAEAPIAEFFAESGLIHALFFYNDQDNSYQPMPADDRLPMQVAEHLQRQGWLEIQPAKQLIPLESGGYLANLADRWLCWQPTVEATAAEWLPAHASQLFDYLQHVVPHQANSPLWNQAQQQLLQQDIVQFLYLLTKQPHSSRWLNNTTYQQLCQRLEHCSSAEGLSNDQRVCFKDSPTLDYFLNNFMSVALQLMQYQRLTLEEAGIKQNITPTIALQHLLNSTTSQSIIPSKRLLNLLEAGADVNSTYASGVSILMYAVAYRQRGVVNRLLADPLIRINQQQENGITALMLASCAPYPHLEMVADLLKHPQIDPNISNLQGRTVLMAAVIQPIYPAKLVEMLLKPPAIKPNLTDAQGYSAFLLALIYGSPTAVRHLLLSANIDALIKDKHARNALQILIWGPVSLANNNDYIIKLNTLLNHPAIQKTINDIDETTGLTLLMGLAIHPGSAAHLLMLERLLCCAQIDLTIQDQYHNSALQYARLNNNSAAAERLCRHRALLPEVITSVQPLVAQMSSQPCSKPENTGPMPLSTENPEETQIVRFNSCHCSAGSNRSPI